MSVKKKILIVDDDTNLADMYATKFRSADYDVTVVYNTAEMGAQFASGLVPDLLLLDVIMPLTNGIEAVAMIMDTKGLEKMKIVLLSNMDYQNNLSEKIAARISAYCVKANVIPSQVLKLVDDLLADKPAAK